MQIHLYLAARDAINAQYAFQRLPLCHRGCPGVTASGLKSLGENHKYILVDLTRLSVVCVMFGQLIYILPSTILCYPLA